MSIPQPEYEGPDVELLSGSRRGPSHGLIGYAESRLLELAEDGKQELMHSIHGLVTMAQELAARAESAGGGLVAGYARQAADLVHDLHGSLRDRPVAELLDDGRTLIRRSPGVAVAVAVAAGFVAARLFKSGGR